MLEHGIWGAGLVVMVKRGGWDVHEGARPEAIRNSLWKAGVKRNLGSAFTSLEMKVATDPSGRITARAYAADSIPQYSLRAMLMSCSALGPVHCVARCP